MEKQSDQTEESKSQAEESEFISIFTQDKKLRTYEEKTLSKWITVKMMIDEMRERQENEAKNAKPSSDENKESVEDDKSKALQDAALNSIELKEIPWKYLDRIVKFIEYYEKDPYEELPKPLPSSFIEDVLEDEFYIKFWEQDFKEIEKYFDYAMYLNYKPLTSLMAARIAAEIKDKQIDEIRKMFNIENDFSEEEYRKIEEEIKMLDEIPVVDE